jgi:hypothetical protein
MPHSRLVALIFLAILTACATTPPKPAMAPLGVNGPFGYSELPIVQDKTSVTYTGPFIEVTANNPRNDGRLQNELTKTYDLALWRAAQIGQQQGYASLRIDHEQRDSDVDVRDQPIYRSFPNYAYGPPCLGRCYGRPNPFWFDDGYYDVQRYAKARAIIRLSVIYKRQFDPADTGALSIATLLAQMQLKWGNATY